jgi:hypothetical protein
VSTGHTEGDPAHAGGPASEEELRAAYEAEIKKIGVEQVLLENVVTLINLGMRRTGLAPGTEDERDLDQVRVAIESIRALMPIVEQSSPGQAGPIREALSQLQLAFVRLGGAPSPAGAAGSGSEGGGGAPSGGSPQGGPSQEDSSQGGPPAGPSGPAEPEQPSPSKPGEPGPAQRSGRLWVPGQ